MNSRNIILLSFFFVNLLSSLNGQCFQEDTIPYAPIPFDSGTAININDDSWSQVIPVGFTFCFYNQPHTTLSATDNGGISFVYQVPNSHVSMVIADSLPTMTIPQFSALLAFQDLFPLSGYVRFGTTGSMPNRIFFLTYDSVMVYGCFTDYFTGQLQLFETSNNIEFHIAHKPICASWNGGLAIQGLQSGSAYYFSATPGRNATQWTATNDAVRFTPSCPNCNSLSAENSDQTDFIISPNPASSELNINFPNSAQRKIILMNSLGQLVLEKETTDSQITLSTTAFDRGLYELLIQKDDGTVNSKKIILQ